MEIRTSVSNYLWNKGGSIMSRHNLGEKNMNYIPTWLFVLILVTNAILFLVPHWL